jgi:3-phenylpropionate/trans-cinnamate dioxygenase ferredoxin subunit
MNETSEQSRTWIDVAAADEIGDGEAKTFQVGFERVAVARATGQLYAVQDLCSHDDGPLGDGTLCDFAIECPRHGARFDVRTGAVVAMPAAAPIETFPVMEKDGRIHVAVPDRDVAGADDDSW